MIAVVAIVGMTITLPISAILMVMFLGAQRGGAKSAYGSAKVMYRHDLDGILIELVQELVL